MKPLTVLLSLLFAALTTVQAQAPQIQQSANAERDLQSRIDKLEQVVRVLTNAIGQQQDELKYQQKEIRI